MLRRELKTAYYHSVMHIARYLQDGDQWQSHNPVWCRFVCTICAVEISVDGSIVVLTIATENVTLFINSTNTSFGMTGWESDWS